MISSWTANWHEKLFNDPCLTGWLVYDWLITVQRNVTEKSRHRHLHKPLDNTSSMNRHKNARKKTLLMHLWVSLNLDTHTHPQEGSHMPVQLITWMRELIKGFTHWMLIQTCCSRSCQSLETATGTSDHDLITLNMSTGSILSRNNIYIYLLGPLKRQTSQVSKVKCIRKEHIKHMYIFV